VELSVEALQKRVTGLSSLPTLPHVVKHVGRMVEDKKSSAADVGELISRDQVLSAKILRLVNSPVYGFPGRISSVTHALVLLGFNVVKGLVLSTAVFDTFGKQIQGLWEHSLWCAIVSRRLAKELNIPDIEEVMVAGLLHDLGKPVLSYIAPNEFGAAVLVAREENCHIAEAEREVFQVDHAHVASWIAGEWHLPARLSDALTYHHRPGLAKASKEVTAIVHLADILTRGMGYGEPGDPTMPPLDHEAYQLLGLSFEQIDRVLEHAEMEYSAGSGIFGEAE